MIIMADLALAQKLEGFEAESTREYAQVQAVLHPETGATTQALAGGQMVFAGARSPLSRAVGLGLNRPVTAQDLDQMEAFYYSRGAPVQIDLCPLADASLTEALGHRGYRLADFENVWFRTIRRDESFPHPPAEIQIAKVGPKEAEIWTQTVSRGFAGREHLTPDDIEIADPFPHMASLHCYLALIDGEPVGAAALAIRHGLAVLFTASTRVAFRKRGVQTALLHHRLVCSAAAGCDLAVVQTKTGSASQRNVERLGFRLAYTKTIMIKDPDESEHTER